MIIHRAWQPPGQNASFKPQKHGAAFRAWLQQPKGRQLLDLECRKLDSITPILFGYIAVIIGEPNFAACFNKSVIKKRFLINEDLTLNGTKENPIICSSSDKLPLESGTVDVVYLAHSLEFAHNPHETLREAYRILRPDGHLILTMFNPMSSWGAWRKIAKFGNDAPWLANFMPASKLRDWLALLGFDIMRLNNFGFSLPFGSVPSPANEVSSNGVRLSIIERLGQKIELPFGAAYLIEANKRIIPITPIGQAWKAKPDIIVDDIVEPTT